MVDARTKELKLSKAQHLALQLCDDKLTPTAATVERVRADVLTRLEAAGLIAFHAYAKEPHWSTTVDGHAELLCQHSRKHSRRPEVLR